MNRKQSEQNLEQRRKGSRRRMRLLAIIILAFMTWAVATFWDQSVSVNAKKSKLDMLQSQKEQVVKDQKQLQREIKLLHNNEYLGQYIRKNQQIGGKDETLFSTPKDQ